MGVIGDFLGFGKDKEDEEQNYNDEGYSNNRDDEYYGDYNSSSGYRDDDSYYAEEASSDDYADSDDYDDYSGEDDDYFTEDDSKNTRSEKSRSNSTGYFRFSRKNRLFNDDDEDIVRDNSYFDSGDYPRSNAMDNGDGKVILAKAPRMAEVRRLTDKLAQNYSLIVNFEGANQKESQRVIDFLSGATTIKQGKVEKISSCCFFFAVGSIDLIGRIMSMDVESYFFE